MQSLRRKLLLVRALWLATSFMTVPAIAGTSLSETESFITGTGTGESQQLKQPVPDYLELPKSWNEGFRMAGQMTERDQREYAACLMLSPARTFEMTPLIKGERLTVESGITLHGCNGLVVGTIHTHTKFVGEDVSFFIPVPSDKDFAHFLSNSNPSAMVVSGDEICVMVKGHAQFPDTALNQVRYGIATFQAHLDVSIKSPLASYIGLAQAGEGRGTNLYCGAIGTKLGRVQARQLKPAEGPFLLAAKAYLIARQRTPGNNMPKITFGFTPQRDAAFLEYLRLVLAGDVRAKVLNGSNEELYAAVLLSFPGDVENIGFGPIGFAYPDERLNANSIQFACDPEKAGEEFLCSLYEVRRADQQELAILVAQFDSASKSSLLVEKLPDNRHRATLNIGQGRTILTGNWAPLNGLWALNGAGKYITKDWTIDGTFTAGEMIGPCVLTTKRGEIYRMAFKTGGASEITERLK